MLDGLWHLNMQTESRPPPQPLVKLIVHQIEDLVNLMYCNPSAGIRVSCSLSMGSLTVLSQCLSIKNDTSNTIPESRINIDKWFAVNSLTLDLNASSV